MIADHNKKHPNTVRTVFAGVLACALLSPIASAQALRPAQLINPPSEMPVMVRGDAGNPQCVVGQFTRPADMEDDKPITYPVHLGAGHDYLVFDTVRAGAPGLACDTATVCEYSCDELVSETRWVGVIYGRDLESCSVRGSNAGRAYTGPCRYGWVLENHFDGPSLGSDAILAETQNLED